MSGQRHNNPSKLPPGPRRTNDLYSFPPNSDYTFEVTPPTNPQPSNLWNNFDGGNPSAPWTRPRVQSMNDIQPSRRAGPSNFDFASATVAFPQPMINSLSAQPTSSEHRLAYRHSRSELGSGQDQNNINLSAHRMRNPSVTSLASSYNGNHDYDDGFNEVYDHDVGELNRGLSDLSLASEEGLRRFQTGQLPDVDAEWHRLVPEEARDALGQLEVQRQSVLFEVIKSEREYVSDLEAVEQVFIDGLRNAKPPIIRERFLVPFIDEVFGNLREILAFHRRILDSLFQRQREQHPVLQSVADIILDTALMSEFRSAYETYIKHYPLSENTHRKQLKQNQSYQSFILSSNNDPRIRKRDLITFLSRPVTRLPRLNLLLEQILKLTEKSGEDYAGHPDLETLPIILGILRDCIKSTQPGIEAAESKVKFWELCESIVYQKGEIIDMDLYDKSRTLIYIGPVYRRVRSETGFSEKWTELTAALLDNYFLLTKEEKRPNGTTRRLIMSRPLPLFFLRLGSFDLPPESRKEKADDSGGILDGWRTQTVPMYPFTLHHASNRSLRRYTLYVGSENVRRKWEKVFLDTIGVHKVRHDSNMWFNPQTITDGFFRIMKSEGYQNPPLAPNERFTGKILCAAPFVNGSRRYIAVGGGYGVYVAPVNSENFRLVLKARFPTSLSAFTTMDDKVFNRFVVHVDSSLASYSLDILARIAHGQAQDLSEQQLRTQQSLLEASLEKISGVDTNVLFCNHVDVGGRSLLIYSSKRLLSTSLSMKVLEAVPASEIGQAKKNSVASSQVRFFRPLGDTGYVPKDAYDVVSLSKTIGICTTDGIVMADPTNLAKSTVGLVPDFRDAGISPQMAALKTRVEGLKPLGFVRVDANELLVVYDELGCYINKRGIPTRSSSFVKWEIKAVSYAYRSGLLLLICPEFIEVRNVTTGRILQVIEGRNMRLVYSEPYTTKDYPILIAMRGGKDDKNGVSDRIAELIETEEISVMSPSSAITTASIWDEWDM